MHVVTIAARNYLPFTRLLAESFKEHNPDGTVVVLLVDAEPGEIEAEGDFEIATPEDLPLDPEEFRRLALIYDVTELATALKPWALEMLLNRGATTAIYLDPDIVVYSSLDEIERLSREHGIVVTPHAVEPMPRDGLRPTEADIMGSGVYNLGFIAVGPRNVPMLHWWQERLSRDSISAPEQMLFTDQRWIDLVPGLWPVAILRDPGYNVAYWNLDHRPVERRDGQLHAGGSPLRFFHFSGYRPETPWILSKYVADAPRVVLSDHPVVKELCDDYGERAKAVGMRPEMLAPYRYNTFGDGTPITRGMRTTYRAAVLEADAGKAPYPPTAFTPEGDAAVRAWFMEPVRGGVSRLLLGLWEGREDLQRAFPQVSRGDVSGLARWATTHGVREGAVPEGWVSRASAPRRAHVRSSSAPGVNLAGYFAAELGMGTGARLLLDATKAAGLPVTTINSNRTESRQAATFEAAESDIRHPVNVAFVNADQFPLWAGDVGPELLRGRYTIGVWAWEVEEFPEYPEALDLVDEVWGISRFVADAVRTRTDKPVHVVPLPIPPAPATIEPLDRVALGLPDSPYFLFVFDYFSVFERKNPLAVVEAFRKAFAEGDGPVLVIKTINGQRRRVDRERLRLACGDRSDVILLEDYVTSGQLTSLMAEATAYVSLHRSEGYGLTMAESMALGRPVIATAYSGNLDFMNEDNSLLVPCTMVEVGPNAGPYPATTRWADPDVDVAAAYMRRLVDDPAFARDLGERARASVAEIGDIRVTADFVRERVLAVSSRDAHRRRARDARRRARRRLAERVVRVVTRAASGGAAARPASMTLRIGRGIKDRLRRG